LETNASHRVVFASGLRGGHTLLTEIIESGYGSFAIADCGHLRPHAHSNEFEFCFILGGEVEWNAGTSVDSLREGDVYTSYVLRRYWRYRLSIVAPTIQRRCGRPVRLPGSATLLQYWLRQRVRLARAQLLRADKTVTDIAAEPGFSSSQHFSRAFPRMTGLTPTAYRMAAEGEFSRRIPNNKVDPCEWYDSHGSHLDVASVRE
jgi:AraC-like DNA-binding protein